jgi:hypothetical protein
MNFLLQLVANYHKVENVHKVIMENYVLWWVFHIQINLLEGKIPMFKQTQ